MGEALPVCIPLQDAITQVRFMEKEVKGISIST